MEQVWRDGNEEHKVEYHKSIWVGMRNDKHMVSSEVVPRYNEEPTVQDGVPKYCKLSKSF